MLSLTYRSVLVSLGLVPALLAVATPARADKVLVYQKQTMDPQGADEGGSEAADLLEDLGHDVTREISLTAALPTDLSGFDAVWVIQIGPTSGVEQTTLVDYVNAGGGLYLTGENHPCCSSVNASLQNIINRLTPDITTLVDPGAVADDWDAATDTWGITTTPNPVPTLLSGLPGAMSKIPLKSQVYKDSAGGKIGAAAWTGEHLKQGGGCVLVMMDVSFWTDVVHPEIDKSPYAENFQHFLGTCADSDRDGLTDLGEEAAGTNPDSPDSDGDGLCDGFRSVLGVCIAGESALVNTDEDDLIDPLDSDDDNDTIPTSFEVDAELANPNSDDDKSPAWVDVDSDGNNIPDRVEGFTDHDGDGVPSITDRGDDPENCDEDSDCDVQPGSLGCSDEDGFCTFPRPGPGEGGAGNGPVAGAPSAEAGSPSSSGGAPGKGGTRSSEGGDRTTEGGDGASEGGDGTHGGNPANSSNDSGGCGCSVPGRPASALGALSLMALLLLRRRTSHRHHS